MNTNENNSTENFEIISKKIRAFLTLKVKRISEIDDNHDMFRAGLINSMFAMQLVIFLETTWSIKVENSELNLENFSTISGLTKFITNKI